MDWFIKLQDFKGSLYQSNGISNSRGVAIWIKKNVELKLIDEYKDNEGRLLLINVEINNAIYTIQVMDWFIKFL
jgi:hypothetical protein